MKSLLLIVLTIFSVSVQASIEPFYPKKFETELDKEIQSRQFDILRLIYPHLKMLETDNELTIGLSKKLKAALDDTSIPALERIKLFNFFGITFHEVKSPALLSVITHALKNPDIIVSTEALRYLAFLKAFHHRFEQPYLELVKSVQQQNGFTARYPFLIPLAEEYLGRKQVFTTEEKEEITKVYESKLESTEDLKILSYLSRSNDRLKPIVAKTILFWVSFNLIGSEDLKKIEKTHYATLEKHFEKIANDPKESGLLIDAFLKDVHLEQKELDWIGMLAYRKTSYTLSLLREFLEPLLNFTLTKKIPVSDEEYVFVIKTIGNINYSSAVTDNILLSLLKSPIPEFRGAAHQSLSRISARKGNPKYLKTALDASRAFCQLALTKK